MELTNKLAVLTIAALLVTAVAIAAVVYYTLQIHGTGMIKAVGLKVYADANQTKEVSAIDWGMIAPGYNSSILLYLKSTSTVPSNLTLTTEDWTPVAAQSYMTLVWNYTGSPLQPGELRPVLFTLQVSEDIFGVTNFSFDIVITAAG